MTTTLTAEPIATRIEGPAPEADLARDLLRRAVPAAAVLIAVGAVGWGSSGAMSAAYGTGLVALNFAVAAWLMTTTAPIGLGVFMGAVLFGYAARLAAIFAAVWMITGASWYEPVPLAVALVVAHLGLLAWELRHVSATLAHPGLKPTSTRTGVVDGPQATISVPVQDHKETSS